MFFNHRRTQDVSYTIDRYSFTWFLWIGKPFTKRWFQCHLKRSKRTDRVDRERKRERETQREKVRERERERERWNTSEPSYSITEARSTNHRP